MWDQITYPYQKFDDATFEVWTWISDFITHFSGHRLSMLGLKWGIVAKDILKITTNAQGPVSI